MVSKNGEQRNIVLEARSANSLVTNSSSKRKISPKFRVRLQRLDFPWPQLSKFRQKTPFCDFRCWGGQNQRKFSEKIKFRNAFGKNYANYSQKRLVFVGKGGHLVCCDRRRYHVIEKIWAPRSFY
jgi:hypothetical protein